MMSSSHDGSAEGLGGRWERRKRGEREEEGREERDEGHPSHLDRTR